MSLGGRPTRSRGKSLTCFFRRLVLAEDEDMAGPSQETTIFHVAMEKKLNL